MESEVDEESRDSQVIDVIPLRFEDEYENQISTLKVTSVKGKYYKQTYRSAWEQMPDFKGKLLTASLVSLDGLFLFLKDGLEVCRGNRPGRSALTARKRYMPTD